MLRRLTLGFAGVLAAAIAIAGCSSSDATQTISVGPNFTSQTLYAANVSQNAVNIYTPSPKSTNGPQFQINGGNTTLAGPQYLTFDSSSNLYVTNWLSSTNSGLILEFKALATGNVLPFQSIALGNVRPRGIADTLFSFTVGGAKADLFAVAITDPSQPAGYNSLIHLYSASTFSAGTYQIIGGPATGLAIPSGVAFDKSANLYVTNLQGKSVEVFAIEPTASPTPTTSPTASPTASPSPTPTPVGSTPTPSTTATPLPIVPISTISGASSDLGEPTGIALDSNGKIYVTDQASSACTPACPAVLIFPPGANGNVAPTAIAGPNTLLAAPTDVKVDSNGDIFVADTAGGSGVIYEYTSTGNVAPVATLKSAGSLIGLGLAP